MFVIGVLLLLLCIIFVPLKVTTYLAVLGEVLQRLHKVAPSQTLGIDPLQVARVVVRSRCVLAQGVMELGLWGRHALW